MFKFVKKKDFSFTDASDAKLYRLPIMLVLDGYYTDDDGKYHYCVAKEGHWIRFMISAIYAKLRNKS